MGFPQILGCFVIRSYLDVFQLTVTKSSISPQQVFGLYLSKVECLLGSWATAGTYGTNIELYIFSNNYFYLLSSRVSHLPRF